MFFVLKFIALLLLSMGWGFRAYASICTLSDPDDFSRKIERALDGECLTSESSWLARVQPYFENVKEVSVLSIDDTMDIYLRAPIVLDRSGPPLLVVASEGAVVRLIGSSLSSSNAGFLIKRPLVFFENITWSDFSGNALRLEANHMVLKKNKILKSGKKGSNGLEILASHIHFVESEVAFSGLSGIAITNPCVKNISIVDSQLHHNGKFGIRADGYQVQVLSDEFQTSIHDNEKGGIFFQSETSTPCEGEKPNTLLVSQVDFYGNGGEGIQTTGPAFPTPSGVVGIVSGDSLVVSGRIPFSRLEEDPWRLGVINPDEVRVEIYAANPEDDAQGKFFLGETKEVSSDGSFRFGISLSEVGEEVLAVTAIAVDPVLHISSPFATHALISSKADADGDGLPDDQEDLNGNGKLDLGESNPRNKDSDRDGLSDGEERGLKLNPLDPDSDGDCLPDGLEMGRIKEEILELWENSFDSENLNISSTCVTKVKEEGTLKPENGIWPQGVLEETWENLIGLFDADPQTKSEPGSADSDKDQLKDGEEDLNLNGKVDEGELDPNNADSDGDGFSDGEENAAGVDPKLTDTDGDGAPDGLEVEQLRSDPKKCDTDGDGLGDGLEAGIIHPEAVKVECRGLQPEGTNFENIHQLDPTRADSDNDGLLDGEEDANKNGWLDPEETDPTIADTDGDGLKDGLEQLLDNNRDGLIDFELKKLSHGEKCSPPADPKDVDCDGFVNGRDLDSDNDDCMDSEEELNDSNDDGILDVWQASAKKCASSKNGGNGGGATPSLGGGAEPSSDEEALPSEVLPARGGGACQLIHSESEKGSGYFLVMIGLVLLCVIRFRRDRRGLCQMLPCNQRLVQKN